MNNSFWKAMEYARDGMFVPKELTEEVLSLPQINKTAKVAVLYAYEMVPVLKDMGFRNITVLHNNPKPFMRNACKQWGAKLVEEIDLMKFNLILGNPPFQETKEDGDRKDQASNLWSDFWSSAISQSKDDATVALITPTSWLSPSADLRGKTKVDGEDRLWNIFDRYTSHAKVRGVKDHFPGVGSSFGYVVVDKSGSKGISFDDGSDTRLGFLPKSGSEEVFNNIGNGTTIGDTFIVNQSNEQRLRVSVPMTRKVSEESVEILRDTDIAPASGSDKPTLFLYVYCNTVKEAKSVRKRVIECKDILNTHCRWSGFLNIKMLKMIDYVG
jgi:hypothetical protein